MALTHCVDTDLQILCRLDVESTLALFCVNKSLANYSFDETVWKEKLIHDYGLDVYQATPSEYSPREEYLYLREVLLEVSTANTAADNGELDVLLYLKKQGILPSFECVEEVINKGRLEILTFFEGLGYEFTEQHADLVLCQSEIENRVELLGWFLERGIKPTQFIYLVINKDLETLAWLLERGFRPDSRTTNEAIRLGDEPILSLLLQNDLLPDAEGANEAAVQNNIQLLNRFELKGVRPDQSGANRAVMKNSMEALEWMAARNLLPTSLAMFSAVESEDLSMMDWLAAQQIAPTQEMANIATKYSKVKVIDWLGKRGIYPTQTIINQITRSSRIMILECLEKYQLLPDKEGATRALTSNDHKMLSWLASRRILPETESISSFVRRETMVHLDSLVGGHGYTRLYDESTSRLY